MTLERTIGAVMLLTAAFLLVVLGMMLESRRTRNRKGQRQ